MIKKTILCISFLIFSTSFSFCQVYVMSVRDCIDYALKNSYEVKKKENLVIKTKYEFRKFMSALFPSIDLSSNVANNFAIQKAFIPDVFGISGPSDPNRIAAVDFGTAFNVNGELKVEQVIYNAQAIQGLEIANKNKELVDLQLLSAKEDKIEKILQLYYNNLINEEKIQLLAQNIKVLDTLLKQSKTLYEIGFREKTDTIRLSVNKNNALLELEKIKKLKTVDIDFLKMEIGISLDEELILKDNLSNLLVNYQINTVDSIHFEKKINVKILNKAMEISHSNVKFSKLQFSPKINIFAKYGWSSGFNELKDITNNNGWFPYGSLGVTMTLPIPVNGKITSEINIIKIENKQLQEDKEQIIKNLHIAFKKTKIEYDMIIKELEIRKINMDLNQQLFEIAKIKLKEGMDSSLELARAETDFRQSITEYYDTFYRLLITDIEMSKSSGHLVEEYIK